MGDRHVKYDIRPKALDLEVVTLQQYIWEGTCTKCAQCISLQTVLWAINISLSAGDVLRNDS